MSSTAWLMSEILATAQRSDHIVPGLRRRRLRERTLQIRNRALGRPPPQRVGRRVLEHARGPCVAHRTCTDQMRGDPLYVGAAGR